MSKIPKICVTDDELIAQTKKVGVQMDLTAVLKYSRTNWQALLKMKVIVVQRTKQMHIFRRQCSCTLFLDLRHQLDHALPQFALAVQYRISEKQCHEQAASVDSDSIALAHTSIPRIFSDTPQGKIYDMDQTGSICQQVPRRTLPSQNESGCNNS